MTRRTRTRYVVDAYHGWADHDPLHRSFSDVDGAVAYAAALAFACALDPADYPLVDLSCVGPGLVARRRLVGHPFDRSFDPVDDFAGGAS